MVAGSAVQKFGPKLEEHQQLLMAAFDILIQVYLYRATDIVIQKGKEAIVSFAEGDEQRMMLLGLSASQNIPITLM